MASTYINTDSASQNMPYTVDAGNQPFWTLSADLAQQNQPQHRASRYLAGLSQSHHQTIPPNMTHGATMNYRDIPNNHDPHHTHPHRGNPVPSIHVNRYTAASTSPSALEQHVRYTSSQPPTLAQAPYPDHASFAVQNMAPIVSHTSSMPSTRPAPALHQTTKPSLQQESNHSGYPTSRGSFARCQPPQNSSWSSDLSVDSGFANASPNFSRMSRQTSTTSHGISEAVDMMRLSSNHSNGSDLPFPLDQDSSLSFTSCMPSSSSTGIPSAFDQSQILSNVGSGLGMSISSSFYPSVSSCDTVRVFHSTLPEQRVNLGVHDMQRSASGASSNSSTSNLSRTSLRTRDYIANAERPIQPKPVNKTKTFDVSPHASQKGDGSATRPQKTAISKAPYIRKKQPKLTCTECDEFPDGFRGPHELQRHRDRAHAIDRKVWICTDPTPEGTFLSHCKHCKNRKEYGVYYNAAAHLRRAHFNPSRRGRKPKGMSNVKTESKGGKAGGDQPSIEWLKGNGWLAEVSANGTADDKSDGQLFVDEDSSAPNEEPTEPQMFSGDVEFEENQSWLTSTEVKISGTTLDFGAMNRELDFSAMFGAGSLDVFNTAMIDQQELDSAVPAGFECSNYNLASSSIDDSLFPFSFM